MASGTSLDFKTNRVGKSGVAALAAAYEMQMLVYGLATEQILGVPPASLTLHFLRTGEEHAFAWNAAARQRAVQLVEAGIAASVAADRVTSRLAHLSMRVLGSIIRRLHHDWFLSRHAPLAADRPPTTARVCRRDRAAAARPGTRGALGRRVRAR